VIRFTLILSLIVLGILFTGDILLSRRVADKVQHRKLSPWVHFADLFHSAQWVSGNLEGALGSPSDCQSAARPCFATSESLVRLLKEAGFHGLSVENNHAGDLGSAGRERTRRLLEQESLLPIDFENSPEYVRVADATIALLAITVIPAADGRVQQIPSTELSEKLRTARQRADLVVVSIHWGVEYQRLPDTTQRTQARWLVQQGADLIVGHHPHVVQSPECVEGHPVFFSLGNHVFDQVYPPTKEGLIADCRLSAGRLSCDGIRTLTERATAIPNFADVDRASHSALATCTPKTKVAPGTKGTSQ
jgi:poly-gamma-glutamate synthesis protein (capsule biosynthesis protein)